MIWLIVQLIFPLQTVALTWLLYRHDRRMLAQVCCMTLEYKNGLKFLVQILMMTAFLFHFIYSCAYKGYGIMLSTILVVSFYSLKWRIGQIAGYELCSSVIIVTFADISKHLDLRQ